MSQGEAVAAVAGGVLLYAHGNEAPKGKPNQERGIALHAAQAAVSVRAHGNLARVAAKVGVTVASTNATVDLKAAKHLLVTAAGAYLRIEGGNIELAAPSSIEFKAARKEWAGARSVHSRSPAFPLPQKLQRFSEQFDLDELVLMDETLINAGYLMRSAGGRVARGRLDFNGMTARIYSEDKVDVELLVGDGDWDVFEDVGAEDLWVEENNEGITHS